MRLPASTAIRLRTAVLAGGALARLRRRADLGGAHRVTHAVHPGAIDRSTASDHQPDSEGAAGLAALAYELLDAHADTAHLADGLPYDLAWAAHLDYLAALQRKGREVLARIASEELSLRGGGGLGSLDVP
jgi:hypothetical protein